MAKKKLCTKYVQVPKLFAVHCFFLVFECANCITHDCLGIMKCGVGAGNFSSILPPSKLVSNAFFTVNTFFFQQNQCKLKWLTII